MRLRAKVDGNQNEIVGALRAHGCSVHLTHQLGGGYPDLNVGLLGITKIVEVKDGTLPPSKRKLTPDEQKFYENWKGNKDIIENYGDVVKLVNRMRLEAKLINGAVEQVRAG